MSELHLEDFLRIKRYKNSEGETKECVEISPSLAYNKSFVNKIRKTGVEEVEYNIGEKGEEEYNEE